MLALLALSSFNEEQEQLPSLKRRGCVGVTCNHIYSSMYLHFDSLSLCLSFFFYVMCHIVPFLLLNLVIISFLIFLVSLYSMQQRGPTRCNTTAHCFYSLSIYVINISLFLSFFLSLWLHVLFVFVGCLSSPSSSL